MKQFKAKHLLLFF